MFTMNFRSSSLHKIIPCVQKKKAESPIFVTLIFENIAFFISSDKTLPSEKNDTKIIEIGWVVFMLW